MGDSLKKDMQVLLSTKCHYCDITLEGREQFVGHTIHSHDIPFERAEAMWKSIRMSANSNSITTLH